MQGTGHNINARWPTSVVLTCRAVGTWVEKDRVWTYRASEAVFGQGAGLVSTMSHCHMHIDSIVEALPLKGRWLPSIRMKILTTPAALQTPLVHGPRNRQLDAAGLDQGGQAQ